jgi:hypothetical protein
MEPAAPHLDGSTVIWAIMAVTGLWLVGLLGLGIGYSLTECLSVRCIEPAPDWVWWASMAFSALVFAMSGRVAIRMTGLTWTWTATVPGLVFLLVLAN